VVAETGAEVAIVIFVEVLGVLFFALLISSISELLAQANRNARRLQVFRAKMQTVERWMLTQALPPRLQRRIKHLYADVRTLLCPCPVLSDSVCPTLPVSICSEGGACTPRIAMTVRGIAAPPSVHKPDTPFHPFTSPCSLLPTAGVDPAARGKGGHCAVPGAAACAAERGGLAGLQSQLQVGCGACHWLPVAACGCLPCLPAYLSPHGRPYVAAATLLAMPRRRLPLLRELDEKTLYLLASKMTPFR
jgi:hypothetical protein